MRFFRVTAILSFLLAAPALSVAAKSLSADDIAKIRDVHKRYETTWLKGDADGVRSLFTDDCVILPHHGGRPRVGKKELDEFWFAPGGPATTLTTLIVSIEKIGGDGEIAYVWGTDEVAWTTVQDGKTTSSVNKGTFLNILQKQPNGEWKITHYMWDDPVPTQ